MKGCPPVTINVDAIVDRVKSSILGDAPPQESVVEGSAHRIAGLGKIGFVPDHLDGTNFVLGFVTLPSITNFATKLADAGVVLPQVAITLTRPIITGITFLAHLFTGGKSSFLLGSFLGMFPSTLDTLAGVAVNAIAKKEIYKASGLGASSEEQQLVKLRQDLERLQGLGDQMSDEPEMSGYEMVVN